MVCSQPEYPAGAKILGCKVNATMWDTETDALESQLAEWFPHGIQAAETRIATGTEETEELLDAALAALIEWVD
jgi:hypothetical protein